MGATFRIVDQITKITVPAALAVWREIYSFLTTLEASNPELDHPEITDPVGYTQVNIRRLSLAQLARPFEQRDQIIAVLDEAQFMGRKISIRPTSKVLEYTVSVSDELDGCQSIDLSYHNTYAVLAALGQPHDSTGEIPLDTLKERLCDPVCRSRFKQFGIEHRLATFDTYMAINHPDQYPVLAWA